MKYIERNGLRILTSEFGYLIHNKTNDSYSEKVYLGKYASLDDFEEVEDKDIDKKLVGKVNDIENENVIQYDLIDTTMLALDEVFLLFGKETKGLPEDLLLKNLDTAIRIPMKKTLRSLNLSNSAAIVTYELLRQANFNDLEETSIYLDEKYSL